MTDGNTIDLISSTLEGAGDVFPITEARSFWRDLCESTLRFTEDRDPEAYEHEVGELINRYAPESQAEGERRGEGGMT